MAYSVLSPRGATKCDTHEGLSHARFKNDERGLIGPVTHWLSRAFEPLYASSARAPHDEFRMRVLTAHRSCEILVEPPRERETMPDPPADAIFAVPL